MQTHQHQPRIYRRRHESVPRAESLCPVIHSVAAYALLKIEDHYQLAGQQESSLLDLMDNIPGGKGIDFEAPRLQP